jgi:hypothetical protein
MVAGDEVDGIFPVHRLLFYTIFRLMQMRLAFRHFRRAGRDRSLHKTFGQAPAAG